MSASLFDRLAACAPLNKTSALVTGRGTGWEPAKRVISDTDAWQENPLPLFPLDNPQAKAIAHDLVGRRLGWLTVVGYGGRRSTSKSAKAVWVVRCDCGMYGHRKYRSLQKETGCDMCPNCDYLQELKAGKIPIK